MFKNKFYHSFYIRLNSHSIQICISFAREIEHKKSVLQEGNTPNNLYLSTNSLREETPAEGKNYYDFVFKIVLFLFFQYITFTFIPPDVRM